MFRSRAFAGPLLALAWCAMAVFADEKADERQSRSRQQTTADVHEYLRQRVERLGAREPAATLSVDEWRAARPRLREELFDMLGLAPLPKRSPLHATVTGQVEASGVVVEKLVFQSRPGLYVTANFYRPAEVAEPLPAVLYLNGHAKAVENGVSLGNKVSYQHHGCWLAQNGYCCLTIDTLQLGEIPGEHHGTYRLGQQWWVARGYTPAGVEAWNAIRALDYLETRPEVDAKRIGVTGRSGGGAYSWWLAALDDRPTCLVPVAGITDLENHVVDHCIQGHCDCMYHLNYAGWDFATVAALAAPRPCLLANTDKDGIFPLDGVMRVHERLRRVYGLLDGADKLGVFISEGPHSDTQELQLAAFRWLNRFLREEKGPIAVSGEKLFPPASLKVFMALPTDQRNETAPEWFVPAAQFPMPPATLAEWNIQRQRLLDDLRQRSFRGIDGRWPLDERWTSDDVAGDWRLRSLDVHSEENLRQTVWVVSRAGSSEATDIELEVADDDHWNEWLTQHAPRFPEALSEFSDEIGGSATNADAPEPGHVRAIIAPRGWGPNAWSLDAKSQTHMPRKFVLAGTTVDEGRVWDVRRAALALRQQLSQEATLTLRGRGSAAGIALYAGLLEPTVSRLELDAMAASHRQGPYLMGVLRVLDAPQAVALCFPRPVVLHGAAAEDWRWTEAVSSLYSRPPLRIEPMPP